MSQRCCEAGLKNFAWRVWNASALAMLLSVALGGCGRQAVEQLAADSGGSELEAHRAVSMAERDSANTPVSTQAPGSADRSTAKPLTVDELVKLAGDPCETPVANAKCISEELDFEFAPDCAKTNYYAGVKDGEGVSVVNGAPPKDTTERAVLAEGQLVCVQAVARAGKKPSYLFVTAISAADTRNCFACKNYGAREVVWRIKHASLPCLEIAQGRYTGSCVRGWVDSEKVELLGKLR